MVGIRLVEVSEDEEDYDGELKEGVKAGIKRIGQEGNEGREEEIQDAQVKNKILYRVTLTNNDFG